MSDNVNSYDSGFFDASEWYTEAIVPPEVPIAAPISPDGDPLGAVTKPGIPGPAGMTAPQLVPDIQPVPSLPPFEQVFRPCKLNFKDGCYAITLQPNDTVRRLVGTVRVDRGAPDSGSDLLIVSGDLYWLPAPVVGRELAPFPASAAAAASTPTGFSPPFRPRIPLYPRANYHSYLRGTSLSVPSFTFGNRPCTVTLDAEQFDYTQPTAGSFKGSFPTAASRSVRFTLAQQPPGPIFFGGPRFSGRYSVAGVDSGAVYLTWVSSFLRRAILEIDTLTGAVPPAPVPAASGSGTEYFDTIFAGAKWDLTVVDDQTDVPVPAGVQADQCWTSGDLHNLMTAVRHANTNLDSEWRTHLVVVPATMGCSRGVMYDQIDVPREGSASFSNDGYPVSHSSNFGTAAEQMQRNVPRAYLRSAAHEVTHAFNQIHQENETSADNSIMTTTPSVADVLGGPTTGEPGVFPDQINLGFNPTVRNHLAHMPDPVVRPGGWPFGSWFGSLVQAADREWFRDDELSLSVAVDTPTAAFGAPVSLSWTLENTGTVPLTVPTDISLEALCGTLTVEGDRGEVRQVRPFVIECEALRLAPLEPGKKITAHYRVFWSSEGFALDRPGRHVLTVAVGWSANGVPVGVRGSAEVWVDSPASAQENSDAALVMHPEVGKWVALNGNAYHLTEATDRLEALSSSAPEVAGGEADERQSRLGQHCAGMWK
ncbi:MAG: hypothetical protein ABWY57_07355 [Mycetocola sp.]